MAKDETRRLNRSILEIDKDALAAIADMADYSPAKPACALADLQKTAAAMTAAQDDEAQKEAAIKAARDDTVTAEWKFHDLMLDVKDQVIAQYGRDSNEAQAVGLIKKSQRKNPTRHPAAK